jgi:hypothetical protein
MGPNHKERPATTESVNGLRRDHDQLAERIDPKTIPSRETLQAIYVGRFCLAIVINRGWHGFFSAVNLAGSAVAAAQGGGRVRSFHH